MTGWEQKAREKKSSAFEWHVKIRPRMDAVDASSSSNDRTRKLFGGFT